MTSFEQVVRPFQTGDVTPPELLPLASPTIVIAERTTIGNGEVRSVSWSSNSSSKISGGHYKQTDRKTEKKRIFDPNDKTQFIDVQRTTHLKMKSTLDPNDKLHWEFKYDESGNQGNPPADGS